MNLRDHDDDCIHGFRAWHSWDSVGELSKSCPGGAAVDIDYEAALQRYLHIAWAQDGMGPLVDTYGKVALANSPGTSIPLKSDFECATAIVDAALVQRETMNDKEALMESYAGGRGDEINLLADLGLLIPIEDEALAAEYIRLAADQVSERFGEGAGQEFVAQWPELSGK